MKIALSASQPSLDSELSSHFGASPHFVIVETESMEYETVANPNPERTVSAEIGSAHLMAGKSVQRILTGHMGSLARELLSAEGIETVTGVAGRIRDLVDACSSAKLHY
jgi:predicted Fe-Mo cluster-binding NifX family protein